MSFFESVVKRTRKMERLLEENYQAAGKGLHEKVTSVENKLDSDIVKQIRFIASVRNKLMHEDGYDYDDSESDFLKKCDRVIEYLENYRVGSSASTAKPSTPKSSKSSTSIPPRAPQNNPSPTVSPSAPKPFTASNTSAGKSNNRPPIYQGGAGNLFSTSFIALIVAVILYPIVGIGGCIVRIPLQGSPPSPYSAQHDKWLNNPPLNAFSTEAIYIPLLMVLIVFSLGLVNLFRMNKALRFLLFLGCLLVFGYVAKSTVEAINIRDRLARTFGVDQGSIPAGGSKEVPKAKSTLKVDKVTAGRTANEKVYEFVLPPNQWVETDLQIKPNQEVMVHHFASSESVKVNLGGVTDTRLQKAGTILPLYTSKDCSKDKGVKAKVEYTCIQLSQPEKVKLFAASSVRVGVVVKNR